MIGRFVLGVLLLALVLPLPLAAQDEEEPDPEAQAERALIEARLADEGRPGFAGLSLLVPEIEAQRIERALAERPPEPVIEEPQPGDEEVPLPRITGPQPVPNLFLGALIYVGPDNWSVWANDRAIASDRPDDEVAVTAISPDGVAVFWTPEGEPRGFSATLRPNQTLEPRRNRLREGFVPAREAVQPMPPSADIDR